MDQNSEEHIRPGNEHVLVLDYLEQAFQGWIAHDKGLHCRIK